MPLKRFWLFSKNIDRIASEFDLRAIRVSTAKLSEESMESAMKNLSAQLGTVLEFEKDSQIKDEKLDLDGLMALKAMM